MLEMINSLLSFLPFFTVSFFQLSPWTWTQFQALYNDRAKGEKEIAQLNAVINDELINFEAELSVKKKKPDRFAQAGLINLN